MKRTFGLITLGLLTGTVMVGTADARSVPAFSGRAATGSQLACFGINSMNGWVTNQCTGQMQYEIPLHADSNGSKSVDMEVSVPVTSQTACRVVAASRTGTNITSNGFVSPTLANAPTSIILTGAVQITKGLIWVDCAVGAGANLIQVDWNN